MAGSGEGEANGGAHASCEGAPGSAAQRPALPPALVDRGALLARLDPEVLNLIAAVAPAGYGKTTLLSLWSARHDAAWHVCTGLDEDPRRLALGIVRALQASGRGDGAKRAEALLEDHVSGRAELLADLLLQSVLDPARGPARLVLDDYHRIAENAAAHQLVDSLLDRAQHLTLGLTSRRMAPLGGLARLQASGRAVVVGPKELEFTMGESVALLARRHGVDLDEGDSRHLQRLTGGWPALVSILGQVIEGGMGAERRPDLGSLRGDQGATYGYLARQLLDDQPPDARRFLLATSVLDTLEPAVCAVLCPIDAASILRRLEEAHVVSPIESGGERRHIYHQLLVEFLRVRLDEELGSTVRVELCAQAGAWYASRGRWEEAFTQWERGGLYDCIGEHLERWERRDQHRAKRWEAWIRRLPADVLDQRPLLIARKAFFHMWRGRPADAFELQNRAESIVRARNKPEELTDLQLLRARLLFYAGQTAESLALFRELEATAENEHQRIRARLGLASMLCYTSLDLEQAATLIDEVESHAIANGQERTYLMALNIRALAVERLRGRYDDAIAAAHRLLALAPLDEQPFYRMCALLCLGFLSYDLGLDDAEAHLEECLLIAAALDNQWWANHVRAILALRAIERDDLTAAQSWLEQADRHAVTNPRSVMEIHLVRAWMAARRGDAGEAEQQAERAVEVSAGHDCHLVAALTEHARILLALGERDRAHRRAAVAFATADELGTLFFAVRGRLIHCASGSAPDAADLEKCLSTARRLHLDPLLTGRDADLAAAVLPEALDLDIEAEYAGRLLDQLEQLVVRVHLFGGLRIWLGRREMTDRDFIRPRARAIFAFLLLHDQRPVWTDELIEAFWAGDVPAAARNRLRVAISQLRKALHIATEGRAEFPSIETAGDTYALNLGPNAWRQDRAFERRARAVLAASDGTSREPEEVAIRRTLALATGDLLPEYRYEDWIAPSQTRLHQLRRDLHLRLAQGLVRAGRSAEAATPLLSILDEFDDDRAAADLLARVKQSG